MTNINVVKIQVVKDKGLKYEGSRQIRCAEDAAKIFREYIGEADREHFVVMALSTKHYVNAVNTVSVGSLDASIVHPREVFKAAILANASGILCLHNHPSGDPTPSEEDYAVTKRIVDAGKILGIDVLDHIVVGDDGKFTSIRTIGRM